MLEDEVARERRARFAAERETVATQRSSSALAVAARQQRVADLLARVARDEEAVLSRARTDPKHRARLVARLRRMVGS